MCDACGLPRVLDGPSQSDLDPHRVDAVQAALAQLTGIEQADQILMHGGSRVDGAKILAQYNLPEVRLPALWLEQGGWRACSASSLYPLSSPGPTRGPSPSGSGKLPSGLPVQPPAHATRDAGAAP